MKKCLLIFALASCVLGAAEVWKLKNIRGKSAVFDGKTVTQKSNSGEFELYGTVEAIVCCLDSVNHITDRAALSRCFHWVHNYLVPGGLFIFDVNTPYKFEEVYGNNAYVLEDEGVLCAWQNCYRKKSKLCDFYVSVFTEREDGTYEREDTKQTERLYTLSALKKMLSENGLEFLSVSADTDFSPLGERDERYYITARAIKE